MKIQYISLFPEMFDGVLNNSMLFKAQKIEAVSFNHISLRDFGLGPRNSVDDTPYGGGDGMLFMIEPMVKAIEKAKQNDPSAVVILPTPAGQTFIQSTAKKLASSNKGIIILCPRYEGYDERILKWVDYPISIGNYVLTGGELPAMVITDSIVRLLPGVLGGKSSVDIESFQDDDKSIEFPQYTRPVEYRGLIVPDVLISGHHQEIAKWRQEKTKKEL
jgi:tRNA (guanine37-N1)-methyltransferase